MRIKGYGAGLGERQNRQDPGRERAEAFRTRHSIGERIKGRVLRRDPSGLYWVQVGQEELLARLEVQTEPGDQLLFVVRALIPEIRLQALQGDVASDDLPELVQRFRSTRQAFESCAGPVFHALAKVPPVVRQRQEAFAIALHGDAETSSLHTDVQAQIMRINEALTTGGGAVVRYEPWLLPSVRRQEIVHRQSGKGGFSEAFLSGRLTGCGEVEVRLLSSATECSLRLLAEHPEQTGALQVEIAALVRDGLGVELELLGVARLASSSGSGVLAELLGDAPLWSSGGLNTRV
jgi:hypothetical protein